MSYKWVALSNTTLGTGMAAIDGAEIPLPAVPIEADGEPAVR